MAATVPPQIKDVVSFIFVQNEKGEMIANGTGFFVGVKRSEPTESYSVYLVTAKHVLRDKQQNYFPTVYVRLNTNDGGSEFAALPIRTEVPKTLFTHADATVDIGVIPVLPDQKKYDFKFLPDNMLTTKEIFEKNRIREGDEVFFTGLFISHYGQRRNYPIVRFGRVCLVTDEKVNWDGELVDLYLIETQSYGGNSGAPVFFYLSADREPGILRLGPPPVFLAGVMKGSFQAGKEVQMVETRNIPVSYDNIGIAAVVPAYRLHEILFSEELNRIRNPQTP